MRGRLALTLSIILAASNGAWAASAASNWPKEPIHIISPLPAGSAADVVARLIAKGLTKKLGETIIVDDRSGASGMIGTAAIAHAAPDGYTLGVATTTTLVTAPILGRHAPYDVSKDFAPIAMVGYSPYVLVVNKSLPANNLKQFIALAKSKPGQITYSSVGDLSLARLMGSLFSKMAGVKLNEIPYKSSTQAVIDLLGGRIDSQFGILTTSYQFIRDGKLKALGVSTPKRLAQYPKIPTIAQEGLPGFDASLWFAIIAPANIPQPIAAKLNASINAVLDDPKVRQTLFKEAIVVNVMTPTALKSTISRDIVKWKKVAVEAGL